MKHALMPHHNRPANIDGHPHWIVRSANGAKLATIYTSDINGHSADFSAEVDGSLTCRVIPGSPCLPLTNPNAVPPLAWADVAAEVGAMLEADGWTVWRPGTNPDTGAPEWSDEEAEFFHAVAFHAYSDGYEKGRAEGAKAERTRILDTIRERAIVRRRQVAEQDNAAVTARESECWAIAEDIEAVDHVQPDVGPGR